MAATAGELEPLRRRLTAAEDVALAGADAAWQGRLGPRSVLLVACGVGTVAAATSAATIAADVAPSVLLMTGIAGAYVGAFVPVGAAVAAASEFDLDAGVLATDGMDSLASIPLPRGHASTGPLFERIDTDPAWREALERATGAAALPFATSDAIAGDLDVAALRAGRSGASVESMEGFGAALACARVGLPFAEVRGISNVAGVRDKRAWDVAGAVRAASYAVLNALEHGPG